MIPWKIETDYAYSWSGSFIVPPEKPFLESMTALAFLAGATESVKLGVSGAGDHLSRSGALGQGCVDDRLAV